MNAPHPNDKPEDLAHWPWPRRDAVANWPQLAMVIGQLAGAHAIRARAAEAETKAVREQLREAVEALRAIRELFANGRGGYDDDPAVRIVDATLADRSSWDAIQPTLDKYRQPGLD